MSTERLVQLRKAIAEYSRARQAMLAALDLPASNRDPLAEFSEHLVKVLVDGELAKSRVQRSYDVIGPDDRKIQVKYLANPPDAWINEHHVKVNDDMDEYGIVFYEALLPVSVIVFATASLRDVGEALDKRHPNAETTLQLTRRNYLTIVKDPAAFAAHGVRVYRAPGWILAS